MFITAGSTLPVKFSRYHWKAGSKLRWLRWPCSSHTQSVEKRQITVYRRQITIQVSGVNNTTPCEYSSATLTNFGDHPHRQAILSSHFPCAGWYLGRAKSSFVNGQHQLCCGLLPEGFAWPFLVTRQAPATSSHLSRNQAVVGQVASAQWKQLPVRGAAHAAYTTAPMAKRWEPNNQSGLKFAAIAFECNFMSKSVISSPCTDTHPTKLHDSSFQWLWRCTFCMRNNSYFRR